MAKLKRNLSELELLQQLNLKLDQLIAITAIQGRKKDEQIRYLVNCGYSNGQIATLLALPKGTIDTLRAKLKRKA